MRRDSKIKNSPKRTLRRLSAQGRDAQLKRQEVMRAFAARMDAELDLQRTFYWDGVDHEILHCRCGTADPKRTADEGDPTRTISTCLSCGTIAELDEETCEWVVREEARS